MSQIAAIDNHPQWDLLPELPLLNIFTFLDVFEMKKIRLVNNRWNEVVQNRFENEALLTIEIYDCIIDPTCPPWSVFKISILKIKNLRILAVDLTDPKVEEFLKEIGTEVEMLFLAIHESDKISPKILFNFPKLKKVNVYWSILFSIELPETIEAIVIDRVSQFISVEDSQKFEKILEMKNLVNCVTDSVFNLGFDGRNDLLIEFIKMPLDDGNLKRHHLFDMTETRELKLCHIKAIRYSARYEEILYQLHNLKDLYFQLQENGCFFTHNPVKLDNVVSVFIRTPEELIINEESHDEAAQEFISNHEIKDSDAGLDTDSDSVNSQFNDSMERRFEAEEEIVNNEGQLQYCQDCIKNLVSSCPNISQWSLTNILPNFKDLLDATPKKITSLIFRGICKKTDENFSFAFENLVRLRYSLKIPLMSNPISRESFAVMNQLHSICFKNLRLSNEEFQVIIEHCPSVKEAEFKELSVERVLMIEEKWPKIRILGYDCIKIDVEKLIDGLQGTFTELREMYDLIHDKESEANPKYMGLYEKIPTLRNSCWMTYKHFCQLKYVQLADSQEADVEM